MKRKRTGIFLTSSLSSEEPYKAFVPDPLPPSPSLKIEQDLQGLRDRSLISLGRLDSVSTLLPDPALFIYMYVRKEAVLSSQIEGTQSSLSDLLLYENEEAPGVPLDEVREVSNYVAAMEYGLKKIKEGFPISLRLIKEIHEILLRHGRGASMEPGEFRRSQNWVGGSRPGNAIFVPPPPDKVLECMGELEMFLHDKRGMTPVLIKAALTHIQFETIHPFLDGNGRLGRLLITFLLCSEGILVEPILYLSLYFKKNRSQYYDLLQKVRIDGDWEAWLRFFFTGIKETSELAVSTARSIAALFDEDRNKVKALGRTAGSAIQVHHHLQKRPATSIPNIALQTGLSKPTVSTAIKNLEDMKIVREISGKKRDRLYLYDKYISILNEGTEPL